MWCVRLYYSLVCVCVVGRPFCLKSNQHSTFKRYTQTHTRRYALFYFSFSFEYSRYSHYRFFVVRVRKCECRYFTFTFVFFLLFGSNYYTISILVWSTTTRDVYSRNEMKYEWFPCPRVHWPYAHCRLTTTTTTKREIIRIR